MAGREQEEPKTSRAGEEVLSDKLQRFFPGRFAPGATNTRQAEMEGVRFTLGEVAVLIRTADEFDTTRAITRTVAYCELEHFRFPRFELQPHKFMVGLFGKAIGLPGMDFPAVPEFSRVYRLTADHAESARKLFNAPLLQGLLQRPGLVIASGVGSLVLYCRDEMRETVALAGFASEAARIFRLFQDAAHQSGLTAEGIRAAETDYQALIAEMPGLTGMMARKSMVTRANVDAFIRQPLPRKIPANILARVDNEISKMFLLVGMMFTAIGSGLTFGFANTPPFASASTSEKTTALLFLALGICAVFFGGWSLFRTRRMLRTVLRHGQVGAGRIEKIDDTGARINGQAISMLTVRYQFQGQDVSGSCKISGQAIERARALAAEGRPAPILYSTHDPRDIMFIDDLLTVGIDYEP